MAKKKPKGIQAMIAERLEEAGMDPDKENKDTSIKEKENKDTSIKEKDK